MTSPNDKLYLVLTAVGPDRPGIVSELSALIHRAGANLEDSRMAVLGGEFALLLLVSGSDQALQTAARLASDNAGQLGLDIVHRRTTGPRRALNVLPYHIRVSGFDRPGIVQAITSVLARRRVNVGSLSSNLAYAPHSGTPLFVLEADLEVPSETVLSELRRELVAKCDDENLDLSFEARR
ncbi:MAG TPA: ACT domain-containing protein [Polyangiaceae bacterium]